MTGTIYYDQDAGLVIVTRTPLHQIMKLSGRELYIYYPDDTVAMHIAATTPFPFPFLQAFLSVVSEDLGLSDLGFELDASEKKADTLVTVWRRNPPGQSPAATYVLRHREEKILRSDLLDAENRIVFRSVYGHHTPHRLWHFPLLITTEQFIGPDTVCERVGYTHPRFDVAIPDSITGFEVPAGIKIQELSW